MRATAFELFFTDFEHCDGDIDLATAVEEWRGLTIQQQKYWQHVAEVEDEWPACSGSMSRRNSSKVHQPFSAYATPKKAVPPSSCYTPQQGATKPYSPFPTMDWNDKTKWHTPGASVPATSEWPLVPETSEWHVPEPPEWYIPAASGCHVPATSEWHIPATSEWHVPATSGWHVPDTSERHIPDRFEWHIPGAPEWHIPTSDAFSSFQNEMNATTALPFLVPTIDYFVDVWNIVDPATL